MKGQAYQTISKYGRINLDRASSSLQTKNINVKNILSGIKHINDRPLKKRSESTSIGVSQRLLFGPSSSLNVAKTRSRYLPRQKQVRKVPVVRKYEKKRNSLNELPSSAQYTPNFDVCLPSAPQFMFPRALHERMLDANHRTQCEMIKVWEKGPRTVKYGPENKDKKRKKEGNSSDDMSEEEEEEEDISSPPSPPSVAPMQSIVHPPVKDSKDASDIPLKSKKQPVGIISSNCVRDSFIPKSEAPAPGQYQIKRLSVDKNRLAAFDGQSTRKGIELLPDRSHFGIGKSIDSTKPQPPRCIPFSMQLSRNKETKQKDIWSEIEKEQKQLYNVLHPQESIEIPKKQSIQPFSQQTTYFDKHPFQSFMGPEETKDLVYDVEQSLKLSDKKIKPFENFGRRTNDSDRAIYVASEAPDIIYKDVNLQWIKTQKNNGSGPIFKNMNSRKCAYDYMPKISGGNYTTIKNDNWSYRTPALMDKMGEIEMMLNLPPQYL